MPKTKSKSYDELAALAEDGRPRPLPRTGKTNPGDDWGSDRQIEAENLFFRELEKVLDPDDFADLEAWCLKATTDEMLDEGLRRARIHFGIAEPTP